MKTLYKKDSKDRIRYLKIYTKESELIQESGVLDTDNPISHKKTCIGKNIGKSNETTPSKQAILEVNSIIKDKLTEGYFETIEEANKESVIMPMLAKSFDTEEDKIDWNTAYIQPKLDGCRMLAFCKKDGSVKLLSRQNIEFTTLDHIKNSLKTVKQDIILDGEAYLHGVGFQNNMKLIKKYRKGETEKISFNVYDIVSNDPFDERYYKLLRTCSDLLYVDVVPTTLLTKKLDIIKYHKENIKNNYEGSIIRWGNSPYKINGRSSNLLKYKDFQDITAKIIDIIPNEANPLHGTPILKYINGTNISTFKAGVKMSHEDREDLLKNKSLYIGQTAEIRFFEWTDDGNPRFPIMVGIRLDL